MFVGEAPGQQEDLQGIPFVGRAGKLLDELLHEIGLDRKDVFIANVLKCRPPGNRDPQPDEIDECEPYLMRADRLIEPKVICTLGNFATKLPSRAADRHHAGARPAAGARDGRPRGALYPLFHPAAALRTPATKELLREDIHAAARSCSEQHIPAEPGGTGPRSRRNPGTRPSSWASSQAG